MKIENLKNPKGWYNASHDIYIKNSRLENYKINFE